MRGRAAVSIELNEDERVFLEAQLRRHKAARSLSDRCRIVLKCADGFSNKEIASVLDHSEHTVGKWRNRFAQHRIAGLSDEYRAGRPRTVSDEQVAEIIKRTLETTPKDATHWSIRTMAARSGLSHTTVRRIWNAFGFASAAMLAAPGKHWWICREGRSTCGSTAGSRRGSAWRSMSIGGAALYIRIDAVRGASSTLAKARRSARFR